MAGWIIGFIGALLGVGLGLLVLEYRMQIQMFLAGIGFDPFPVAFHGTANIPVVIDWTEIAWQGGESLCDGRRGLHHSRPYHGAPGPGPFLRSM